ncbi:MAG TPA: hypothetical protein VFR03_21310 [Thermoanaerobaculia bacterium]|nr:hypothetical protein [Thermoanaerobaculia bacterium]
MWQNSRGGRPVCTGRMMFLPEEELLASETGRRDLRKRWALWLTAALLVVLFGLVLRHAPRRPPASGQLLVHFYPPRRSSPGSLGEPVRGVPAVVLQFAADGQYVERTGYLIDSGNGDLSFSPGDDTVVAVGTWDRRKGIVTARRERVVRAVPYAGPDRDPLCVSSVEEYHLARDGVSKGSAVFHPSPRLRLTDWNSYVATAKSSGVSCRVR